MKNSNVTDRQMECCELIEPEGKKLGCRDGLLDGPNSDHHHQRNKAKFMVGEWNIKQDDQYNIILLQKSTVWACTLVNVSPGVFSPSTEEVEVEKIQKWANNFIKELERLS